MKKILLFCIFYTFVMANSMTIKQAWDYILQNNDGIKAEQLGIQRQQKLTLASKLSFLPEINITAFYTHLANPIRLDLSSGKQELSNLPTLPPLQNIFSGIPNHINLIKQDIIVGSLNIIYPLYSGGRRYTAIKIAKLQEKDSQEAFRLKKLATFEELAKIYYGVWLQKEILITLKDIEQGARLHYNNAIKLHKAGQVAQIEVLGAQVALDKSKNKLKEAKNTLEISKMTLDTILDLKNVDPISKIQVKKIKINEESFVEKTIHSYPILKTLEHKILVAKEIHKMEYLKFLPDIALMGSYFVDNHFLLNHQSLPSWYIGVAAKLPIVSPGGRIPQIQASKIAQIQLDKTKSQAQKDIELLARHVYKEVVFAQAEYWSLQSSIQLAQENLKLQEKAFIQGIATSAQVTDARNLLASTLIEQKTIAYKYIILLSKLMALSDNIAMFYEIQN